MSLVLVTVVKDDLAGLLLTERSVRSQSLKVHWILVTPNNHSQVYDYSQNLLRLGVVKSIIEDSEEGIYEAMNLAIQKLEATDWIWFLNAGDEFSDSDSYSYIVEVSKFTSEMWLFGGNFLGAANGKILGYNPAPKRFNHRNQLFAKNFVCHQSAIFSVDFLQKLGGFQTMYRMAADWDLMVRASKINPGLRVDRPLSVFYMGGFSTLNRQVGNFELLQLRRKYLGSFFTFLSYPWFVYRKVRNNLVVLVENSAPQWLNTFRALRFQAKEFLRFNRW